GDDFTLKRNLILMVVKNVKCIDREGHIEISVMTKGKKWRSERGLIITARLTIPHRSRYREKRGVLAGK
ncbi:MAG: hypothetical protein J6W70_06485, partial [Lentisphaeria bacterium]|nr:hypothetical protein [Lentisphaeria bacterium]